MPKEMKYGCWRPTMKLRILKTPDIEYDVRVFNGEVMENTAIQKGWNETLQQEWECLDDGSKEWRDVNVVIEE